LRIAVVSDIHGNLPALEAVLEDIESRSVDQIWCGGDIAWGGPWAVECIERVRSAGWPSVKGNTDVWIAGDPQGVDDPERRDFFEKIAADHAISSEDAAWLLNLPLGHRSAGSILLVHGTPQSPFEGPMPDAPASEFLPYQDQAACVIYGHVHQAFVRRLTDGAFVCNTGSVGLPKDGDTASYLLIDRIGPDHTFRIPRVTFDRAVVEKRAESDGGPASEWFLGHFRG
jgi:putative phosphoesterase